MIIEYKMKENELYNFEYENESIKEIQRLPVWCKLVIHALLIFFNKGGKFLKKLWCCVGGSITR